MILRELNTGDAFKVDEDCFIAIALCEDPFDVYCLNVISKMIVTLEEQTEVELLPDWKLEFFNDTERKGKPLDCLL